jgi:hypothetical protein
MDSAQLILSMVMRDFPNYKNDQGCYTCIRYDGAINTMISLNGNILCMSLYAVGRCVIRKRVNINKIQNYKKTHIYQAVQEFESMIV